MKKSTEDLIEKSRKKETIAVLSQQLADVTAELKNKDRLLKLYQVETNPITVIEAPEKSRRDYATALTLLSDIHAEHKITLESTNGINKLTPSITTRRLEVYAINLVKRIKKHQKEVKIDELIIGMLGDMIHGFIHEEYLRTNYMTPNEAMLFVIEQLERVIKHIIDNCDLKRITIVGKVGNHSRTTQKVYTDEEAVYSYEWAIYKILQKIFPKINWVIENSYYSYLKVYDKDVRFSHGHEIKYAGGIGGIYVPLQRNRLRANQIRKAHLDCIGHYHTTDFLRNSGVLMNGSGCGADAYSIRKGFEPEPPMQQFLLIDSKRGFTVNEPILLT
jgi:hypothetical protein